MAQQKTIVMITLDSSPGGIEQSLITYIKAYHLLGYHILLYVPAHASIIKKLTTLNYSQLDIKTFNWLYLKLTSLFSALLPTHFSRSCQKSGLIFVHNARLIPIMKRFSQKKTPVLFVDHSGKKRPLIKKADYVITISHNAQKKLIAHYPLFQSRSCCIHHAIELPPASFYCPNEILHIVTAGRFVEKKGLIIFIKAIALIRDRSPSFRVTLAGDGPQKKMLTDLISKLNLSHIVSLPGWLANTNTLFKSADIVCLPSLLEPFGLSLAEAMACGRACITTDCEGPLDIIADSNAAIVVPRHDVEALAKSLLDLLNHTEKRLVLAHTARDQISKNFSMEHLMQQLQHLTNSLYT